MLVNKYCLSVAIAATLAGFIAPFSALARNFGVSAVEQTLFRFATVPLFFSALLLMNRKWFTFRKRDAGLFATFGFSFALLNFVQFGAVALNTPVAVVLFLMYLQPAFTVIISRLWLREELTRNVLFALAVALAGAALVTEPWSSRPIENWLGPIMALFGGLLLSLWVIFGRKLAVRGNHPFTIVNFAALFALVWAVPLSLLFNSFIKNPALVNMGFRFGTNGWLTLAAMTVTCFMAGQLIFYHGVKRVKASVSGIILMIEPVVTAILGYALLSEAISLPAFIGCALIIIATYIIVRKHKG